MRCKKKLTTENTEDTEIFCKKFKLLSELIDILKTLRSDGKKIVFTNGCFDILHPGHTSFLQRAKLLGDVLVVGLNSDRSVRKLKGKKRPLVSQKNRAIVLSALESVDFIVIFNALTPLELIEKIKPDVLVKGGDWRVKDIVGGRFVKSYGGKVKSLSYIKGFSTSSLFNKIKCLSNSLEL